MSLFDAIRRTLSGRRTGWAERGTKRPIADLERQHGGAKGAAQAAGVSKATLWRLKTGRSKGSPETRAKIKAAQRRASVRPEIERTVRAAARPGTGAGLVVSGTFTISADTRARAINFGWHPKIEDMYAAYAAGDDTAAQDHLQAAMNDIIGAPVIVEDPDIDFTPPADD